MILLAKETTRICSKSSCTFQEKINGKVGGLGRMPSLTVSSFCNSLLLITYLNYPKFIYYSNWITTSFFILLQGIERRETRPLFFTIVCVKTGGVTALFLFFLAPRKRNGKGASLLGGGVGLAHFAVAGGAVEILPRVLFGINAQQLRHGHEAIALAL